MTLYMTLMTTCFLLLGCTIEALPMGSSPPELSERERNLLQEIMCLIKGLTAKECVADEGTHSVMDDLFSSHGSQPRESRLQGNGQNARKFIKFPVPVANKRDGDQFYSDWKRRK